jgi:hypothetical protein
MIVNFSKSKEIVFFQPTPIPLPDDDIEQLLEAKVLGIILNDKFHFDSHPQFVIRQCNQRLYRIKLQRKHGLPNKWA